MITSEGWRGWSRGRERRWVSASLEVAQFWDSYSSHLYHLSLIINDHHYHHWLSVSLWGYHSSVIAAPHIVSKCLIITLSDHILASVTQALKKYQASRILKNLFFCNFHA